MKARFSPEVESILRRGGWFEGRTFDLAIYDTFPTRPFPGARQVLAEFGGLRFGEVGPGVDSSRNDFDLRPMWRDRRFKGYPDLEGQIGMKLYPLGQVHRSNGHLLIDESGRVYVLWEGFDLVAPSFDEALELLLLGWNHPS